MNAIGEISGGCTHGRLFLPEFLKRRMNAFYGGRVRETWNGRHILRGKIPRDDDIVLVSNDYLSLADHADVLSAQSEAMVQSGNGVLMSAIFLHGANPQRELEHRLASFMGAEAAILSQSGWAANVGLVQAIADEGTPVYVDFLAHMSLWDGIRAAGANARPFRHNDAASLEKLVRKYGPGVVLVDSVYSTNGSVCPLQEIVAIAHRHGCIMVVDESHSLGTHGPSGAGLVVELGLEDKVQFRTASLAKAFAGRGGIIGCPAHFKDYFAFTARPAIFSSALLPHEIVGFDATLGVIMAADDRRRRLHANASYLRTCLAEMGYNVDDGESQIIALEAGPEPQTIVLRDALESRGVFGSVFCAPATPKNRALVRFSVHSQLTLEQLSHIVEACHEIRDEVDLANWPSTRRRRRDRPLALSA